jgi:hypothetical protein
MAKNNNYFQEKYFLQTSPSVASFSEDFVRLPRDADSLLKRSVLASISPRLTRTSLIKIYYINGYKSPLPI